MPFSVYADHISPAVAITVPERPTTTHIPVQWSAEETGSGIRGYDVEVKIDDGGWVHWMSNTALTQDTYDGDLGHTYAFRVRATDNVSNTSTWVEARAKSVVVKKYYYAAGGIRNKSVGDALTEWRPKVSPDGAENSLTASFQYLGGAQLDHASFRQVFQLKG